MQNNYKKRNGARLLRAAETPVEGESYIEKVESKLTPLVEALSLVNQPGGLLEVFEDLCTPNEWKSICDRWLVAQLISQGISYRKIYEITGVSTATITRVGRALSEGKGYTSLINKIEKNEVEK
jgi:TrpR-related protein YerC/YecD